MLKQLFCRHVYYFVADVQRTPAKYRNEEIKETKHYFPLVIEIKILKSYHMILIVYV